MNELTIMQFVLGDEVGKAPTSLLMRILKLIAKQLTPPIRLEFALTNQEKPAN